DGLDAWMEARENPSRIAGLRNAFVKIWANFRRGVVRYDEFVAALTSTRTESWQDRVLRDRCGAGQICFPYANEDGFLVYTNEPLSEPVPSAVVKLPMSMNLRAKRDGEGDVGCEDSAYCMTGRIETRNALQYPGNPAIHVGLAA